jgi:nitroimidazol reductase NimA-like FMN-containing flavoprotein (pyridoxamine 5'-phosphate oxidase superfamily)
LAPITAWLATVRPDGKPHVMPIGILFVDDAFYFNAGPKTRKARNIARNPNCIITIATHDFDFVVEGPARKIVDRAGLHDLPMRSSRRDGSRRSSKVD